MYIHDLSRRVIKHRMFYLFLVPGILYFAIFRYGPLYGTLISFKEFNISQGIIGSAWASPWYKHFLSFFRSPYVGQLIRNTFMISLLKLFCGMPFSIVLAVFLNEIGNRHFKRGVQTVTYLPHFLSWSIVYGIVYAFFSQTHGIVNGALKQFLGISVPFLTSLKWFRPILIGSDIWRNTGWGAILFLAAIAGISPTLYEAAKIDGANRIQMAWRITIPSIRSIIVVLLILRLGHILDAGFEQVYIMYNIQVYEVADIIDTWVFRTGLEQLDFSIATAVGLLKSVIGMLMVIGVNRLAKFWGESL